MDWVTEYSNTVLALGAAGGLLLVQALVADMVGMWRRHVPGAPVAVDHGDLLFRVTRAHANTNETVAAFVLLVLFAMLRGAPADSLAFASWAWVATRLAHMAAYYANRPLLRSTAFGLSLLALLGLAALGVKGG